MAYPNDPRSEAEKARADLKRNAEIDMSLTETPLTHQPSVTPETFGVHDQAARLHSGTDQGVEAGGRMLAPDTEEAGSIVEGEQVAVGRDQTAPTPPAEQDVPSPTRK